MGEYSCVWYDYTFNLLHTDCFENFCGRGVASHINLFCGGVGVAITEERFYNQAQELRKRQLI